MSTSNINVQVDEFLLKEFDHFCKDVGMNSSVAINLFICAVLRERRIPFDITDHADPFYSISNMEHLRASVAEFEAGRVVEKTMEELIFMEKEI